MKIGQGKSQSGIRPSLAVNEKEHLTTNHPDKTSKAVDVKQMQNHVDAREIKNIQYTKD